MKKIEILLLPKYTAKGPSSRYRLYQYIPYLEKTFFVRVSPFFNDAFVNNILKGKRKSFFLAIKALFKRAIKIIFLSAKNTKLVITEYELIPYFPSIFESILSWKGINMISIYDDAVFHRYDRSNNILVRLFLKNKIKNVMNKSSDVIVGNKYLEKYALQTSQKNIFILPTVVDVDKYPQKDNFKDELKVVWIGSPSTSKYLKKIEPILVELSSSYNFRFIVIGDTNIKFDTKINQTTIEFNESNESANLSNYDIGVMPLYDSEWERGKCGFKLIQYMASGLPTIADDIGANSDIIINGKTGFLCNSDKEWIQNFKLLMEDKKLRKKLGSNGAIRVRKLYSLDSTRETFLSVIEKSLGEA